ncbi:TcdA/TcdB catalytic glycosyltransferase domain-containing protein, partial [Vibrio vulnificus]|uniref:TcdA/TcdB catalytic glycosyltransferase domain-containing protein n=1 Tax=Vibrio vulnificus TaxID=672 RepID=UPI00307D4F54
MKSSIIKNKLKHIESTIINSLETHHNSDSVSFLFNKLINSLTEMDSISVIKNISMINDILIKYDLGPNDFFSTEIADYFKSIEECNKNISAPEGVFFVWIGDIPQEAINYINVWKRSTHEKIDLWCDFNFLLAGKIKSIIEKIYATDGMPDKTLACQDVFYSEVIDYISNKNMLGDQAIISFVEKRKPKLAIQLKKELKGIKSKMEQLGSFVNVKNVGQYDFLAECYYRFYLTEVLLRNNLAAASDILRLSLLYKYGGTYIDVDTLPPLDHIFSKTNLNFGKSFTSKDIVDIFKSKL